MMHYILWSLMVYLKNMVLKYYNDVLFKRKYIWRLFLCKKWNGNKSKKIFELSNVHELPIWTAAKEFDNHIFQLLFLSVYEDKKIHREWIKTII